MLIDIIRDFRRKVSNEVIQWPHTKIIHNICAYDQDF